MTDDPESPLRERPVLGVDALASAVVVRLGGELDLFNADQVRAALHGAIAETSDRVVIDLSQVEFVDSTALGLLLEASAMLGDGRLVLAAPQLEAQRALRVSGLDKRIAVVDSVDEALAADGG